jgi:DnaK suppressor protein
MDYERLETIRRQLLRRRRSLLRRQHEALVDGQGLIAEREPDWPDVAANETAATVIERLGEAERAAVVRIDSSLQRIEAGGYGDCVVCRGPIEDQRLLALPDADRCARCAALH